MKAAKSIYEGGLAFPAFMRLGNESSNHMTNLFVACVSFCEYKGRKGGAVSPESFQGEFSAAAQGVITSSLQTLRQLRE
jgi:hypothetical protein